MNLLELMLKEEVEWPVGAEYAVQDADKFLKFSSVGSFPEYDKSDEMWVRDANRGVSGSRVIKSLSRDWSSRIITREEYQSAGGWMKWEGGECPVDGQTTVDTKWDCDTSFECLAEKTTWMRETDGANIISYRIITSVAQQIQTGGLIKQGVTVSIGDSNNSDEVIERINQAIANSGKRDNPWKPLRTNREVSASIAGHVESRGP